MLVPLASPSVPLVSSQVTTKPPLASPVTAGASWLPVVLVFTENSEPTFTTGAAIVLDRFHSNCADGGCRPPVYGNKLRERPYCIAIYHKFDGMLCIM